VKGSKTDASELLRRSSGRGRGLRMLPIRRGRARSGCFLLLLDLLVMVLVLRCALTRLRGLRLRPIRTISRCGRGLRGLRLRPIRTISRCGRGLRGVLRDAR